MAAILPSVYRTLFEDGYVRASDMNATENN
jgi:hypothetical protein